MNKTNIVFILLLITTFFNTFVEAFENHDLEDQYKVRDRRGVLSILKGSSSKPTPEDSCYCPKNDQPVCGNDRVTYPNPCKFKCAFKSKPKLRIVHQGAC